MMFWFKNKKIVLDCFTTDPFAYEYAKLAPASQYIPQWWKDLPNSSTIDGHDDVHSMKHCRGFTRYYKRSIVLPFWGYATFDISDPENKSIGWRTNYTVARIPQQLTLSSHPYPQYKGFVSDDRFKHFKISLPWNIQTKDNTEFILTDPLWNRSELTNYSVLPGVLDFKYQTAINVNIMLEFKDSARKVDLSPGDVLGMITPLSEKDVELKHHLIEEKEMEKYIPMMRFMKKSSSSNYSRVKDFLQKHEERNKPKCPFGFGK